MNAIDLLHTTRYTGIERNVDNHYSIIYLKIRMAKRGPKLTKEQQDEIIRRLSAGDDYSEIAESVGCTWDNIKYYAEKNAEVIEQGLANYKAGLVGRGLRDKDKRVEKLIKFANRIERDLKDKLDDKGNLKSGLWFKDIKLSSIGTSVNVEVFGGEAIRQYRGILDDIAKELGDRKSETKLSGEVTINQKGYTTLANPDMWDEKPPEPEPEA